MTTSWPHDRDPIAGSFVRALTEALCARGHRCTALFAAMPAPAQPLAARDATLVPVRYAPDQRSLFYREGAPHHARHQPFTSALLAGSFTAALARSVRRELASCDALVSHFALPSALVASLAARGRPHHAILHGTDALVLERLPRALHRVIARGCTSLQFAHPGLRRGLDESLSAHRAAVDLPMAAREPSLPALAARQRTRASLGIYQDQIMVLSVARLAEEKALAALALAAHEFKSHAPVRFVLAGDGPERGELERLARGRVTFTGAVDEQRRDELLAAADVFALPSKRDGAPTAIVEALSYGLPVVTTRVGGIPWLADDAALYVAPERPVELAHTIKSLVDSQDKRAMLSARSRERHRALPTWDSLADHILRSVGAIQ
ncbi:MAG: glycosyltransferase family 4 protein [Polyangiales bacterium]